MSKELTFQFPDYTEYQKKFVFNKSRFTYVFAAPQVGKTDGLLPWLLFLATKTKVIGANFWWVSPFQKQAFDAFTRLRRRVQQSPLKEYEHYIINMQRMSIEFVGGGVITFLTSDNVKSLFGVTVYGCVVDEAALCNEEAFNTVLSRLAKTGGPLKAISNVQGRNWFYKLCERVEKGEINDAEFFRVTIDDAIKAGLTTQQNIDQIKQNMSISRFNELYYCIARENFSNAFGIDNIHSCVISNEEIEDKQIVCFGCDLGSINDFTVLLGLNSVGQTVYCDRWQADWTLTKFRLKQQVLDKPCLIDATGLGIGIVDDLKSDGYDNFEPFTFSNKTKTELINELIIAVQQRQVGIKRSYDFLVNEMENYEMSYSKSGMIKFEAGTGHDDCVTALALAWKKYKKRPLCSFLPFLWGEKPTLLNLTDEKLMDEYNWIRLN